MFRSHVSAKRADRTEGHRLDGQSLADYFSPSPHNNPQEHSL
jgi:hypothetical protein